MLTIIFKANVVFHIHTYKYIYIQFTDNSFVSFTNAFVADNIKKQQNKKK